VANTDALNSIFGAICENIIILQNGFIVHLHSNKGVSCSNIYIKRKKEITTYGQKMLLETYLLQWEDIRKNKNNHIPIVFIESLMGI